MKGFLDYILHHTSYIIHLTSHISHLTSYILHHTSYIRLIPSTKLRHYYMTGNWMTTGESHGDDGGIVW